MKSFTFANKLISQILIHMENYKIKYNLNYINTTIIYTINS